MMSVSKSTQKTVQNEYTHLGLMDFVGRGQECARRASRGTRLCDVFRMVRILTGDDIIACNGYWASTKMRSCDNIELLDRLLQFQERVS